jgi:hypothetical protein
MEVNSASSHSPAQQAAKAPKKKKLSKEDIAAKVAAKFGKKSLPKKVEKPKVDEAEVSNKAKQKEAVAKDDAVGDIGKNDPNSEMTQEKLKAVLKSGAFAFNDKERKALSQILKP